jgi:hypothetical protein
LRAAFEELETVAALLNLQRGDEIHIAATSDFVDLWLRPRLGSFREEHPQIRFSINGEGDVPIRIGDSASGWLRKRKSQPHGLRALLNQRSRRSRAAAATRFVVCFRPQNNQGAACLTCLEDSADDSQPEELPGYFRWRSFGPSPLLFSGEC